jgi:type III pantothenate kinase
MQQVDRVALCSVVPRLTRGLSDMFAQRTGSNPFILKYGVNTGIEIHTDNPASVGSDLIADAAAAYAYYKSNCIVLDFGTATTISAVIEPGILMGTAIAAGLEVTVDALVGRTAQLPQIELTAPAKVIGKNTIHSMQAGLVLGHVCMVEGMINRMKYEIGGAKVIATGGLAPVIAPLTDRFDRVDVNLTLEGLRLVTALN